MTQIDILLGAIGSYTEEALDSTEKLIREHRNAIACWDMEAGINLHLYIFHGLRRFADGLFNQGMPFPVEWDEVIATCRSLRDRMRQQIGLLPDCKELGFPMDQGDELRWAFDRLDILCENLQGVIGLEGVAEAFEDFSDLVESDLVRMNPATEFIDWKAA